jgi:hypothetical protein
MWGVLLDCGRVVYAKLARSLYCLTVDHVNYLKKRFATRDMITMVMEALVWSW